MSTPPVFPWTKPPISYLKCNVDCALFNNNTITGFGFCFRDSSGQFVTGMSNYSHSATSPLEAEALGLFEAIQFAIDRDMTSVIFEADCKLVVDLVYSPIVPQNEIGDIITSCKHLMSVHNSYVVRHTRRQTNRVAHSIARASLSHPNPYIFDYVPDNFVLYNYQWNGLSVPLLKKKSMFDSDFLLQIYFSAILSCIPNFFTKHIVGFTPTWKQTLLKLKLILIYELHLTFLLFLSKKTFYCYIQGIQCSPLVSKLFFKAQVPLSTIFLFIRRSTFITSKN